jgi:hypothetical protein
VKTHSCLNFSAAALAASIALWTPNHSSAGSSFGWFYYQQGDVTTKVDGISEHKADYYPVGYDLSVVAQDGYFQIGMDLGGRWLYDVISTFILWDHYTIDPEEYGMDESFCNFKGGVFSNFSETFGLGYGADLDWRVNRYKEIEGASPGVEKIRVGLGPNVGLRISPYSWITIFPNVSGYYYPWPNKDFAFIPKTFDSFGYRAECPVNFNVVDALTKDSKAALVFSVMPFVGSKSGFFKSNDQTGEVKNASASVAGIKFGFYGWHPIFDNLNWN